MLLFVLCCRSSSLLTDTFCAVRVRVAARSAMFFRGPVLIEWMWFRQRSLCAEKKPCASLGCCAPLLRRFPATSCVILYFRVSPKKHFTTILGGIDTAPSPSSSNSFIFIQHFPKLGYAPARMWVDGFTGSYGFTGSWRILRVIQVSKPPDRCVVQHQGASLLSFACWPRSWS